MSYYLSKSLLNLIKYSDSFENGWSIYSLSYSPILAPDNTTSARDLYSGVGNNGYMTILVDSYIPLSRVFYSCYIPKNNIYAIPKFSIVTYHSSVSEYTGIVLNKLTGECRLNGNTALEYEYTCTDVVSYWLIKMSNVTSNSDLDNSALFFYPCVSSDFYYAAAGSESASITGTTGLWGVHATINSYSPYIRTSGTIVGSVINYIDISPEYNYEITGKKIEDRKRARSGREYVYKWGQYEGRKFDVSYISDAVKTKINSWWSGNDPLLFIDGITTVITSVRIQNDKTPISKLEKPYTNLWSGTIELETY